MIQIFFILNLIRYQFFLCACMVCDGKCFDVLDAFYECGVNLNARSNKFGNVLTAVAQHNVNDGPKDSLKVFRYLIKEASYSKQFDVNMICKIIASPNLGKINVHVPPRENHLVPFPPTYLSSQQFRSDCLDL